MNRDAGWLGIPAILCSEAWPGGKGPRSWQADWLDVRKDGEESQHQAPGLTPSPDIFKAGWLEVPYWRLQETQSPLYMTNLYVCLFKLFAIALCRPLFKRFYLFIFRERGGGEKERERNIDWLPLIGAPPGDKTQNPGICPDRESNWQPFALRDNAQPTEPHWSESKPLFKCVCSSVSS